MKIVLLGKIPSKKNLLRRSKNGGMFHDSKVVSQINLLTLQANQQWAGRQPLDMPELRLMFHVKDGRSDCDNKLTTTLDILQAAGIIRNDNIAHGPRPVTYDWIKDGKEGVVVEINGK